MRHASCGTAHPPETSCDPRVRLLAEEAVHLADRCRDLERRVATTVDRIAALPAAEAAVQLRDLADLLADPDLEVRR